MMICNQCKRVIEDDDVETNASYIGDFGDAPCFEKVEKGCSCGGSFEPAIQCKVCGEYASEKDVFSIDQPICRVCLTEMATVENAIDYSKEKGTTEWEFFRVACFTKAEIFEILRAEVMKNPAAFEKDATLYCLDDESAFSEWLASHGS